MSTENKNHTLSFRLAEKDYERLAKRCAEAELSKSNYLRYLIRIPVLAERAHDDDTCCVVLDKKSLRKMSKELTRWGYHYNQAVHAMNSINYYVTNGRIKQDVFEGKGESIEIALVELNENAERIVYELAQLQTATIIED